MMQHATVLPKAQHRHSIGRIPVRNIWLLFLYAHDLARFHGKYSAEVEASPDLPTLLARILGSVVEQRLRRNPSQGYTGRRAVLSRVRGRIDVLETECRGLSARGMVACCYFELTRDIPRNRLVRSALRSLAGRIAAADWTLAHECRRLALELGSLGISAIRPARAEVDADRLGRHDADDRLMVSLARLAFDLALPTEESGSSVVSQPVKDELAARRLFEKAVGNFYRSEFRAPEWSVATGRCLQWPIDSATPGIKAIFPRMQTDIVIEHRRTRDRLVIDTKFTSILGASLYRAASLRSGYIYQMYAYVRSQESDQGERSTSRGLLLHPVVDESVDEAVSMQGHEIRFATVDLADSASSILARLRSLVLMREQGVS